MKMINKHQREVSAEDVAIAACRELVKALEQGAARPDVRRAAILARFAVAMNTSLEGRSIPVGDRNGT